MRQKKQASKAHSTRTTAAKKRFPRWVENLHEEIESWRENFGETDAEDLLNDVAGYWDEENDAWRITAAQAAYAYGLRLDAVEDFLEWWPQRGVMTSITGGLAEYREGLKQKAAREKWRGVE